MSRIVPAKVCRLLALAALWLLAGAAAAQDAATTVGADGVQRIAIVGGSYFFRPSHIVVRANQPLEIRLSVEPGVIPHRFVLEGPGGERLADVNLETQEQTLTLTLAPGSYPFYCPNRLLLFKSHRDHGMAGTLQVQAQE
ncbi:MAG: cupredoxin domain-containing protein [Proteobacteria bacterium]|nr:cupredoxin domain-containing protein [Pseudomonadota bacterium]MBS0492871.1 cupredoxin domain-containing protein [Pseudomonadota bacterium]